MSLFLSIDDIERLTGFKRKAQQCAQLDKMFIPYRVNGRGEPIVSSAFINGLKQQTIATGWQPNLKVA